MNNQIKVNLLYALAIEEVLINNKKLSVGILVSLEEANASEIKGKSVCIELQSIKNSNAEILKNAVASIQNEPAYKSDLAIGIIMEEENNLIEKYELKEKPLPENIKLIAKNSDFLIENMHNQARKLAIEKIKEIQEREIQVIKNCETTYKYYMLKNTTTEPNLDDELSKELHAITNWNPNDYIKPVVEISGDIINLISDESKFKNHHCVGIIALPFQKPEFYNKIEDELENLTSTYGINSIHFNELFGPKKILGNKLEEFITEYSKIVSNIGPATCFALSLNENQLLDNLGKTKLSNNDIYYNLFWNNLYRLAMIIKEKSIIHIYAEQEYSLDYKSISNKLFFNDVERFYAGISQLEGNVDKYLSICKHIKYFTKKALLFSSLSDLVAYSTNKIQNKIDSGVPEKKIIRNYGLLLKTIKQVFSNYKNLSSPEIVNLIDKV